MQYCLCNSFSEPNFRGDKNVLPAVTFAKMAATKHQKNDNLFIKKKHKEKHECQTLATNLDSDVLIYRMAIFFPLCGNCL